jgi:hypothetical protein
MIGRNMRGIRRASIKARVGLAAAVLAGGGAIGAVAVAASNSSSPAAQNAGYTMVFQHRMSMQQALSTALSSWTTSRSKSMQAMAMAPVRNFATARTRQGTVAMQRGVVALATRHWLLVKSSNNTLHLWMLTARTQVMNVAASGLGTAAMTGSAMATTAAMQHNNMVPAAAAMAGTRNVAAMNTTGFMPVTFNVSVAGTNVMLTITITPSTATVKPATMPAAQTMAAQAGTPMTMMPARQPTFMATRQIARGDLVLVTGLMRHHFLWAQVVLFSKRPVKMTPPPTATPTGMMPTGSATPTMSPSMKPTTMMPSVTPAPSATPTTPMPAVTTTPPPFGGTHA